jgi:hypothetical protein
MLGHLGPGQRPLWAALVRERKESRAFVNGRVEHHTATGDAKDAGVGRPTTSTLGCTGVKRVRELLQNKGQDAEGTSKVIKQLYAEGLGPVSRHTMGFIIM